MFFRAGIKEHKTYNTVESTASLHTQSPPFSIYRRYQGTHMMFACVCLDRRDNEGVQKSSGTHTVANGMEASQSCVSFQLTGWQTQRSFHRLGISPCGSLAYLMADAALRGLTCSSTVRKRQSLVECW